jgi:hypothetical protein
MCFPLRGLIKIFVVFGVQVRRRALWRPAADLAGLWV